MSKAIENGPCHCLEEAQKDLAKKGIKLETTLYIDRKTRCEKIRGPFLQVTYVEQSPKKKKLPNVICNFCPFCGKKKSDGA